MKKIVAFTLLEVLLVLAIAGAFIMMSFKCYQAYAQEQNLAALQSNVQMLFQAMDQYYVSHCRNDTPFTVSLQSLPGTLTNQIIKNKLVDDVNDYEVGALPLAWQSARGHRDIYQLFVTVTLDVPPNTLNWYKQRLNATAIHGSQLEWVKMPSYTLQKTDSNFWIMNMGLRDYKENMLQNTSPAYQLEDDTCDY